jgi:S1-C subfamily serine protease
VKLLGALAALVAIVAGAYLLGPAIHAWLAPKEALTAATVPLPKLLNQGTVLILTKGSYASGFFISPQLVLTNRHAVEDSQGALFVGNRELGRMVPADEVATSASSEVGQPDYALLKLRSGESHAFLSFSLDLPAQLQNVTAAGLARGAVTASKLADSDIPDAALTTGAVVVIQGRDGPAPLILHRASIASLTSGGPLVDACGRVLGINTFLRKSDQGGEVTSYALASASAVQFLKQHGGAPNIVLGPCVAPPAAASSRSP